jgi:N-acyl-D-aspartate/D-glutamate deacylase
MLPPAAIGKRLLGVIAIFACIATSGSAQPIDADILLKGGQLLDGSGTPAVRGDVAIRGDRIVAVGQFDAGKIAKTIDCTGLVVCPGFIDLHNHSDSDDSILAEKNRDAANYIQQGCTTLVTGNCGGGKGNVARYLDNIDENGAGANIAQLIPHGSVRAAVLGTHMKDPAPADLDKMRELVDKGMREGAWGMSTGLIYVPSSYGKVDELAALAAVCAKHGGLYASHIRSEESGLLDAIEEALEIGKRGHCHVHISHLKVTGKPYWGNVRAAVKLIEQAQAAGQEVTADQYPYIASSTSLSAMLLPDWAREGGSKETMERMNDPQQLAKLKPYIQTALDERPKICLVSYDPYPNYAGRPLNEIAAEEGRPTIDLAVEVLQKASPSAVNFGMTEEDVRFVMQLPWVATSSDGGVKEASGAMVHPRSFGTFPRKIGFYAVREKVLPLEKAVRSCSGLPADVLGLPERGYLREGFFADVVAFDPDKIIDGATFEKPFEPPQGIPWVIVNGKPAVAEGKLTGSLSGRALRHQSTASDGSAGK